MMPVDAAARRAQLMASLEQRGPDTVREQLLTGAIGNNWKRPISERWLAEHDATVARAESQAEKDIEWGIAREANKIAVDANRLALRANRRALWANILSGISVAIAVYAAWP